MARTSDAFTIVQNLYRFTHAQDRLDLVTMASILAPDRKIKFDLSKHFPDVGVMEDSAAEICNILYEASAGWTATQHPVYNPVVTFTGGDSDKATVEAMVQAVHCLEKDGQVEELIVRANWIVKMKKLGDDWVICGMSMVRDIPIANLSLFERMRERMEAGGKRPPSTTLTVQ